MQLTKWIDFLVGHICQKDKDHQMNFKKHTNYFISLIHAGFITTF